MKFKVLKSGPDGLSGGESNYATIDDVLRQIAYHKGWSTLDDLHASIRKWAKKARPGDVFCTHSTAVVVSGIDPVDLDDGVCRHCGCDHLDYDELEPGEDGIRQKVSCSDCGKRWADIFTWTEQLDLR